MPLIIVIQRSVGRYQMIDNVAMLMKWSKHITYADHIVIIAMEEIFLLFIMCELLSFFFYLLARCSRFSFKQRPTKTFRFHFFSFCCRSTYYGIIIYMGSFFFAIGNDWRQTIGMFFAGMDDTLNGHCNVRSFVRSPAHRRQWEWKKMDRKKATLIWCSV